ncbi:hypothetical protein RJK40_005055 [Salmonella enterica]|nr:hypothetical protein [Salmonella enterica]
MAFNPLLRQCVRLPAEGDNGNPERDLPGLCRVAGQGHGETAKRHADPLPVVRVGDEATVCSYLY